MTDEQVIVDIKVDSEDVKTANKRIDELTDSIEELGNRIKTARTQNKAYQKEQQELNKAYNDNKISSEKYLKEIDKLNTKIKVNNKIINDSSVSLQAHKRERDANIRLINSEVGAYTNLSNQYTIAAKKAKDLAASYGINSKEAKQAAAAANQLNNKLKEIDSSVGQNTRRVGNYTGALKGFGKQLFGALGIIGGITAMVSIFKNAINIFKTFDKESSRLASILGKTKDQITSLTNQAKELGSTTAYTASEVIGLQTELAKLGFTTEEIENSTEGILALAAATGSDLASSAELAGATLRIFNLDASEMSRVTDVLAKSTTISSLSMEKLATIMPTVGKTAQLAGVSLERTAALAGTLTDRGLDASTAATSLRNIFLELSKKGLTWDAAMQQINSSTDKNKTAMDLFGKRAAAAGSILAETADSTDNLTESLENATGAAKEMADVMLDNLAGDVTKAKSAWEGFILSLEDGNGVISRVLRSATQWFTNLFDSLKKVNEGESLYLQKLKKDSDFQGQVNKRWEEYIRLIRLATTKEEELNIISEKKSKLQHKIRGIQYQLNKGYENGVELSTRRRSELEFEVAAYNELIQKLTDYNKPLKENAEAISELTDSQKRQAKEKEKQAKKEKEALEKESKRRAELNDIEVEQISDHLDNIAQVKIEKENELVKMIADINEEARKKELEELEKYEKRKELIKQGSLIVIDEFSKYYSNIRQQRENEQSDNIQKNADRQIDILKNQLDKGIITEDQYNQKVGEIQKEAAIKQAQLTKKNNIFQIGIDTLTAIIKTFANLGWPAGIVPAAFVAGQGALNASLVAATPISFGQGTNDIVSIGGSHSSGNDVDVWGFSGSKKQYFGKVERGEAMPVIKKSAVNDYMVSKLNGRFSPNNGRKFQDGTPDITSTPSEQFNDQKFIDSMIAAFSNVKIVTKIEDITKQAAKKNEIINNSKV